MGWLGQQIGNRKFSGSVLWSNVATLSWEGGRSSNQSVAEQLSARVWICVINVLFPSLEYYSRNYIFFILDGVSNAF